MDLAAAAGALLVGYALLAGLLIRAARRFSRLECKANKLRQYKVLCTQVGLSGRWPHTLKEGNGAPWELLSAEILRKDNKKLRILTVNGFNTFGAPGSPLFETLSNFKGADRLLKVIITHPDCEALQKRAVNIGRLYLDYKNAAIKSEERLKQLREKFGIQIEGRFRWYFPQWRIIITDFSLWIQYYAPKDETPIEQTPLFRFDKVEGDGLAFYQAFSAEFDRLWHECDDDHMLLGLYSRKREKRGGRREEYETLQFRRN